MKKIGKFLFSVKKEMTKVKWPNRKEMLTYSAATIAFILVFAVFFSGLDFILAGLKMVIK